MLKATYYANKNAGIIRAPLSYTPSGHVLYTTGDLKAEVGLAGVVLVCPCCLQIKYWYPGIHRVH